MEICKTSAINVFMLMHQKWYQKAQCQVMERVIKHQEFGWSASFTAFTPLQLLMEGIFHCSFPSGCIAVSGGMICQDSCSQQELAEPRTRFVRAKNQGFSFPNPPRRAPPSLLLPRRTRDWLQSSSQAGRSETLLNFFYR